MTREEEYLQDIIKIFESLRYKRDLWTLYSDFLEMTAIAISNSAERLFLPGSFEKREKRYLSLAKAYDKEELLKMAEAFNLFVRLQDYNVKYKKAKDILGGLLMKLGLGNKWAGQFFTPDHVANLMAKLTYTEEGLKKQIEERGFVYASDSAVGGGVTLIGLVNAMLEAGFNPQRSLFVECGDLDKRACFMTYIQLATLGIPAIVKNQDAITGKVFDVWFTPAFYLGGWQFRLKDLGGKDLPTEKINEEIEQAKFNIMSFQKYKHGLYIAWDYLLDYIKNIEIWEKSPARRYQLLKFGIDKLVDEYENIIDHGTISMFYYDFVKEGGKMSLRTRPWTEEEELIRKALRYAENKNTAEDILDKLED